VRTYGDSDMGDKESSIERENVRRQQGRRVTIMHEGEQIDIKGKDLETTETSNYDKKNE